MPKTGDRSYRLVIFDEIDEPVQQEARELFCKATGAHPTDAAQWLARTPGTWPYPLDEPTTRRLLDGLYELAIAAEAWLVDRFPNLGTPRTIHRAACLAEGLRIDGLRGEPTHWTPWNRVEMICAGRVGVAEEVRDPHPAHWPSAIMTGIRALTFRRPPFGDGAGRPQRVAREPIGEILVVRRDPRVTFRFLEDRMNYSYLGSRLAGTSSENFPVFLADLCDRASDAYVTRSTRALLGKGAPAEAQFENSQALLDYATHRLLWSWYSRERDRRNAAGAEDSPSDPDGPEIGGFGTGEFDFQG